MPTRPRAVVSGTVALASEIRDDIYVVQFRWNRNTEPEVIGYRLWAGRESEAYTISKEMGNNLTGNYTVHRPNDNGMWYFALTALTAVPAESAPSIEASINITMAL